ncbi:MAG: glucose 1-dehydrogenase [Theionarchaea archaeon]|nr:glucose 1-dehydrogenase [Theionarchaea archaeon]
MMLHGKTALITGANSGIGKAISYEFAKEGAHVAVNYIENEDEARKISDNITDMMYEGQKSDCFRADISSTSELQKMIDDVIKIFGSIDILVNNAGIQTEKLFIELTEEEVDRVWAVNLRGTFFCSQFVVRKMIELGIPGKIINITSVHQDIPRPLIAHYAASKGGIRMLTKVMALELASYNIMVNAIAPGAIATPMNEGVLSDPVLKKKVETKIPLSRVGESKEVARAAVFLASEDASYVTGATYYVDGGLSLHKHE